MKRIFLTCSLFISFSVLVASCGSINKTSSNHDGYKSTEISRGENQQLYVEQLNKKEEVKVEAKKEETKKEEKSKKEETKQKQKEQKANKNNKSESPAKEKGSTTVNGIELSIKNLKGEWIYHSQYSKTPIDDNIFIADDRMPYFIFEEYVNDTIKTKITNGKKQALDGVVYANDGCNTLNALFKIIDNKVISFINPLSTQKFCTTDESPYEYHIKNAIEKAIRHDIVIQGNEQYLNFISETGAVMLRLKKVIKDNLDGIWKITKINGEGSKCKKNEYIISIDTYDRKIHGQLPCNTVNGTIIIDANVPNSVLFQNLASTRMTCPDIATETEILIALESVNNYKKDNKKLLFYDKKGEVVLELTNITDDYIDKKK